MKLIIAIIIMLFSFIASAAKVTCASCTPACDSSCSYEICNLDKVVAVDVDKIPFSVPDQTNDSCSFVSESFNQIPYTIDGVQHFEIKKTVMKKYKACQGGYTQTGPACSTP